MIIFGTKSKKRTVGRGTFMCPSCGSEQPYHHMTMQRHGHLYFISLVPMGDVLEVVECETCSNMWDPSILTRSVGPAHTQEAFNDFYETLLNVMILIMLVDGEVEEVEREAVQELFERIVGIELADRDLDEEIKRAIARGPDGLMFDIAAQRHMLDQEMRITFLKSALMVAYSDGQFAEAEKHGLIKVANALEITDEQLRTAVEELEAALDENVDREDTSTAQIDIGTSEEGDDGDAEEGDDGDAEEGDDGDAEEGDDGDVALAGLEASPPTPTMQGGTSEEGNEGDSALAGLEATSPDVVSEAGPVLPRSDYEFTTLEDFVAQHGRNIHETHLPSDRPTVGYTENGLLVCMNCFGESEKGATLPTNCPSCGQVFKFSE